MMHPWVHFDMFLTLPRPSSSMSRRKSPPWREPPAGVLTAIHTPSALPRPRAGAGHDTMHLPCARELPGQLTGQQTSRPATKPAVCATYLHGHAYVVAVTSILAYPHHSTALVPTCHEAAAVATLRLLPYGAAFSAC